MVTELGRLVEELGWLGFDVDAGADWDAVYEGAASTVRDVATWAPRIRLSMRRAAMLEHVQDLARGWTIGQLFKSVYLEAALCLPMATPLLAQLNRTRKVSAGGRYFAVALA